MPKWLARLRPLILALAFVVGNCGAPVLAEPDYPYCFTPGPSYRTNFVCRVVDDEAGVICWLDVIQGGLDCMPISDTRMEVTR